MQSNPFASKIQPCGSDMDGKFKFSDLRQLHWRNMVISTDTDSCTILASERDHTRHIAGVENVTIDRITVRDIGR